MNRQFLLLVLLAGAVAASAEPSNSLEILGPNYPRTFFFRSAEGAAANPQMSYEKWDGLFSRLSGIMGKCLDEEVIGREARNPEWFSRFKKEHPEQVVLLHFNGNARDPLFQGTNYFPGHWIYRKAARIIADVPATAEETVIKVSDAKLFRENAGRYHTANDDIGLFGITPEGKHDWARCEQVQLLAVDPKANTIRVKRGCYGTKPLAFQAGKARAAAHQMEGPWGKDNHLLWYYNFSALCPKDSDGKTASDRLADDLAGWFGPGGKLAALDGLEFDVCFNVTKGDTDGDGEEDDGVIGGTNQYGIGVVEFARQLRARLGPDRIIQADGALGGGGSRSQRAFGILNGIESEGWPNLNDWDFNDWSGGLNRMTFWQANAHAPAFSYINHKWIQPDAQKPGEDKVLDVPFSRHRLAFAAAQFTDAMICAAIAPPGESAKQGVIWDEFVGGTAKKVGWLGKPEGPAVHLASHAPDCLGGLAGGALAKRISGKISVENNAGGVKVSSVSADAKGLSFCVREVPVEGEDLVVLLTMKGDPRKGYPKEMARYAEVGIEGGAKQLSERRSRETSTTSGMTWVNEKFFTSVFYFRGVHAKTVDLSFEIEGAEPVVIERLSAYAQPDAMSRVFENGMVLANPGLEPHTFDLSKLSPGRSYRRIQATPTQDTVANNGEAVGNEVTLGPREGLFLLRSRGD